MDKIEDKLVRQEYNKQLDKRINEWFGKLTKHKDFLEIKETVYESCYEESLNGVRFNKETLGNKIKEIIINNK